MGKRDITQLQCPRQEVDEALNRGRGGSWGMLVHRGAEKMEGVIEHTWACSGKYMVGDMSPLRCPGVCV